jgi:hypothetical protein
MLWARIVADLIVILHACYVGSVVLGLGAIVAGIVFGWEWVRNLPFRVIHLAMIGIVVGEAVAGIPCPLTAWEKQLRLKAGQVNYSGDFLGHWAHRLIFFHAKPWVFTLIYILFGLAALVAFVLAPPRWQRRSISYKVAPR